jgi:NADP-dependent aldehyde dehydrogenase
MLSPTVRDRFIERTAALGRTDGVEVRGGSPMGGHREHASGITGDPIRSSPVVYRADFATFRSKATLREEVFGPGVIVVVCDGEEELLEAAATIQGALTGTIWASGRDSGLAQRVQRVLEQRVGRLIFNGVPTGIEVCEAMVQGGPFPASSDARSTSVGPRAIRRWVRPVCYQNAPDGFLPAELRGSNPLGILRTVDGELTDGPVGARR